ncbi:MAG: hypothetical protein JXB15_14720 [Anaerolineales bacterium]|nr:hypothetical protein [Anaerolineales bacterium]
MPEETRWKYHVETIGSAWSGVKDADLEATLDAWSEQGWDIVAVVPLESSNKLRVVGRRPLTSADRRRRDWPTD